MPNQLTKARLTSLIDKSFIDVHFNPASLVYTVENKSPQTSSSPKKRQFVAQFSGKLTMDLQFDTTSTGDDVRSITAQVAKFMEPSANATHAADEANKKNPTQPAHAVPVLLFEWGSYKFNGIMESFKETIDLFSPEGVALRFCLRAAPKKPRTRGETNAPHASWQPITDRRVCASATASLWW